MTLSVRRSQDIDKKERLRSQQQNMPSWGGVSDDEDTGHFCSTSTEFEERIPDETFIADLERSIESSPTSPAEEAIGQRAGCLKETERR